LIVRLQTKYSWPAKSDARLVAGTAAAMFVTAEFGPSWPMT
jgi:hypothetical protein